eukprot:scaffold69239_cov33-Prasinocladus_malaysianus.AAC.1
MISSASSGTDYTSEGQAQHDRFGSKRHSYSPVEMTPEKNLSFLPIGIPIGTVRRAQRRRSWCVSKAIKQFGLQMLSRRFPSDLRHKVCS